MVIFIILMILMLITYCIIRGGSLREIPEIKDLDNGRDR